jgi:Trypsin-co-occurring domain 1
MAGRVVEVVLPNKTVALVQAAELDDGGGPAEKVGWKDTFDFEQVSGTLEGIAQAVRSGLDKVRPSKTTVELGIQLAVKNGTLTGLLVEGQAQASLKVTLEWAAERSPGG